MSSFSVFYLPAGDSSHQGRIACQIQAAAEVRTIDTGYRIFDYEWDDDAKRIIIPPFDDPRHTYIDTIVWDIGRIAEWVHRLDAEGATLGSIHAAIQRLFDEDMRVFSFVRSHCDWLRSIGRVRCAESMSSTLRSLMRFRGNIDLRFRQFDAKLIERYESFLLNTVGVTRNTSSFYMRNLRSVYRAATDQGLTADCKPFKKVYTGVDKTHKRAVTFDCLRQLRALDLKDHPHLLLARDLYLMSFYLRGMPFVDMAYLRKLDLVGDHLVYRRKKTGTQITVQWTPEMQQIIDRYANDTQYLLPIITKEDGTERRQYQSQLSKFNRHLKALSSLVGADFPLSSYTSRHGWATIARDMGVPISVISQGLGHENLLTTQIYLDAINTSIVDTANRRIISAL